MKPKLPFYLFSLMALFTRNCHAALVYSVSSGEDRQLASSNFDLKANCYGIDLKKLASGHSLSAANPLKHVFSGDAFDREIPKALAIADQLPQVKRRDYEPRLLDIPPILFVAVWLHGRSDDIIIPLPPTFGRWAADKPYSEKEMIRLLKLEAEKVLKAPNLPR